MWKADIDAAFRRIPIRPDHRSFSNVVFRYRNKVLVAEHASMPFGSVASVHHWERVGHAQGIGALRAYLHKRLCCRRTNYKDCTNLVENTSGEVR